ncbi:MAG: hypothetical protein JNJ54_06955 [Myxococcaceae bacterium]|nr:hypothetical protein [Myxococcaceae bacterium]
MTLIEVAVVPHELESHWRQIFEEAGLVAELEPTRDGLRVLVAAEAEAAARALLEPPDELAGDEESDEAVEAPTLGADERTETLVMTQHALVAERLSRELHKAGLFAAVLSGLSSSVFGTEGQQLFTVVVAEGQRDAAAEVLGAWAATHAHDFATEVSLSREELLDVLRHFLRPR